MGWLLGTVGLEMKGIGTGTEAMNMSTRDEERRVASRHDRFFSIEEEDHSPFEHFHDLIVFLGKTPSVLQSSKHS